MVSPALQRGEKGFHTFVTESRRDGARTLFMQEPIAPEGNLPQTGKLLLFGEFHRDRSSILAPVSSPAARQRPALRQGLARSPRPALRHAALRLLRRPDRRAAQALSAGARGPRSPGLLRGQGQLRAGHSQAAGRSRRGLRHRLRRRTGAGAGRRARGCRPRGLLRRGQNRGGDRSGAQSAESSSSTWKARRSWSCWPPAPPSSRRKARFALRVNPDVFAETHPYISTGLREHKFGIDIRQALAHLQERGRQSLA